MTPWLLSRSSFAGSRITRRVHDPQEFPDGNAVLIRAAQRKLEVHTIGISPPMALAGDIPFRFQVFKDAAYCPLRYPQPLGHNPSGNITLLVEN